MKRKIHELFEAQVARDPEHIALIEDSCSISYQMLNIHANQLAYHLRAQGLTEQQPVALCLSRGKRFLIGLLAIIKAGGTYLPLDPNQPEERLHYILKDAGADLLITDLPTQKKLSAFTGKFIIPEHEEKIIQGYPLDNPIWTSPIDNITYIIYTSGSTGTPKGVLIAESALINYCQWFAQYTNIQGKERIDFSANPIFDMAVTVSIVALLLGLTVVICPENIKRNPEKYLRYLHEQEINIIKLTPTYFKILLQAAHNTHLQLPELKRLILGGENLSANECKEWLDLYPDHVLHNEYGPTEATIAVTQYAISKNNYLYQPLNVPIGTPGNNMMCLIVDEHLNLVAPGEMGELIISGRGVARGYLNRPELNQQLFIRNPVNPVDPNPCYRTGDLCRINAQGIIEYYGRKDEQIKIRGFRIEPAEIENQLLLHPTVQNAAVVAQEINHFEPSLVAYTVLKKPQNEIQQEQFKQFLAQYLPDYMIPALFIKIPALPYNANGKLDKKALPKPQFFSKHKYAAPQTALEKKLISLWSAELGIPLPGIDDDFFELGGHSLSAARLIAQINHQLQINVDMQTFYQNANVRDLALKLVSHPKAPQPQFSANEEHYFNDAEIPLADLQFMMWMANTFEPKAKKLNIVARKRFKGHLDKNALDHAFSQLLRKHEVLHYQVAKLRPVQFVSRQLEWTYEEENIQCLSSEHAEQKIAAGLNQLIQFQTWPKNKPALRAKLFILNDTCELQLAMPHVLIDEASLDILFQELSEFYSQHLRQDITPVSLDSHFKAYIKYEQEQIQSTLEGGYFILESIF